MGSRLARVDTADLILPEKEAWKRGFVWRHFLRRKYGTVPGLIFDVSYLFGHEMRSIFIFVFQPVTKQYFVGHTRNVTMVIDFVSMVIDIVFEIQTTADLRKEGNFKR